MSSDELSGKSGKVKVMYVRRDEESPADTRQGRRSGGYARDEGDYSQKGRNERGGRQGAGRKPVDNSRWRRDKQDGREGSGGSVRRGADSGGREGQRRYRDKPEQRYDEQRADFSPWSTSSRLAKLTAQSDDATEPAFDHGGISGNSDIDPDILRRQRAEETRIYGENACQALFAHRPESIVRGWFTEEISPRFRNTMRWLAANRKAYHVVDEEELFKVSGTEHHGGVCLLIKRRAGKTVSEWLAENSSEKRQCILALENVANPHNAGAIMRSCAHFGVRGVLAENMTLLESGAAVRTAEGGAEYVQGITSDDFTGALQQFRQAGYHIVVTSSHKGTSLFKAELPEKMVLLLGQERDGVSVAAQSLADMCIVISGTGQVESLNVSVAAGVLLGEWWRQGIAG